MSQLIIENCLQGVDYGFGFVSGTEFVDTVSFGRSIAFRQSIGAASVSQGFSGVDGVLG